MWRLGERVDELRLLRAITRRFPPWPKMKGVANHLVRRAYTRKQRPAVEAEVLGLRMALDPHELVDGLLLFVPHLFDRAERRFLERHLRPGDTFLDLGAHIGFYALLAARTVGPDGRVVAVEPDPVSRARLVRHLEGNGLTWVEVEAVGLSDRRERRRLVPGPSGNRGATRLVPSAKAGGIEVDCLPIADLLDRLQITDVAAAKLDLEGLDADALTAWLDAWPPARWPRALIVEGGERVRSLLTARGYRVRRGSRHNLLALRSRA